MKLNRKAAQAAATAALVLAGFGGGAVLASNGSANADPSTPSASASADAGDGAGDGGGGHAGETPLTGTTADKVEAAALAEYPGATIDRLETDSDGVYEAHVTLADGSEAIVQVDQSFAVTGTQTGGGHGDHDGDGSDAD